MKLSISVSADEIAVLDDYMRASGLPTRSAAVQHAIRLLEHPDLEADYAAAWLEWDESPDSEAWEVVSADGLSR